MDRAAKLRDGVRRAYGAVAENPQRDHPFPVGREFAESLGYPRAELDSLPAVSVDAFAGLSAICVTAEIPAGAVVLDLGCGAGMDSLIAARKTGPRGKLFGVDFSETMLDRARRGAEQAGLDTLEFLQGDAEDLPLETGSIDVAMANGIFNLNPARETIFRELARVIRPGGVLYAAELILRGPLQTPDPRNDADWFA